MSVHVRWIVGLSADLELGTAELAIVQLQGREEALRLTGLAGASTALTPPLDKRLWPSRTGLDLRQFAAWVPAWLQQLLRLLHQVTGRVGVSWPEVLCAGLLEPWLALEAHGRSVLGLLMPWAASLAEMTGWSVAHAFALRDLAAGGLALPVTAAADWLLFHSPSEDRMVVHLGEELVLHWLPRQSSWSAMRGTAVLPGLGLLDRLACALTGHREAGDRSGHLAVQGRCIPDLLARWQAHPAVLGQSAPGSTRWAFGPEWVQATTELARQRGWSAWDVLCTACHWLAHQLAQGLARLRLPSPPQRIVVTGPGCRNGFLWQLLQEKWHPLSLERSDALGIPAESAQAVRAAVMAALLLDQVPASVPQITGSSGVRLLGQWTPGSLSNWARCLHWMTAGCEALVWEES